MNVGDERSKSFWMDDAGPINAPRLSSDESCDVVVIGAGIAGLSTAYELSRFGRSVVVIDRGKIGNGMTARTTAHLTPELDSTATAASPSQSAPITGRFKALL